MRISITARLTLTSAVLTALIFMAAGVTLYLSVESKIRTEGTRRTEAAAKDLAFPALDHWDDDLMVEFKAGPAPLETLRLSAPHWALIRGDGTVVQSHGIFESPTVPKSPGKPFLLEVDGEDYQVASVPLFATVSDPLQIVPEQLRAIVKKKSPEGLLLRAARELGWVKLKSGDLKSVSLVEVTLLEGDKIVELKMTEDGKSLRGDEELDRRVPIDVANMLGVQSDLEDVSFASWRAHNGQVVAVLKGRSPSGEECELAVNRVGERFVLDEGGNVLRPDPDWRLWMLAASDASAEAIASNWLLVVLAAGLPLLWAAVVLIGWYVTRRALSPVNRIVETVERIELSRLDRRLPVGEVEDELSRISSTVNRMLDRIEEGYRRERRFTGDASHELRGPLAKVIADIEVTLSQQRQSDEYREALVRCLEYACGLQRLVESLMWLARLDSRQARQNTRPFEVTDLIAEVVKSFPAEAAARIQLNPDAHGRTVTALGDPELIRVMLQNLIQNALRYSPPDVPVEVRLSGNSKATIEVLDHGEGIPDDQLEQVFSRFYRVDKSRSRETGGVGLGLAIVHEIAHLHGIRVYLRNVPNGGLVASFSLPICPIAEPPPVKREKRGEPSVR